MLEAVGRPHAVNPDRALRRLAVQRGWPVLAFSALPAGRPAATGIRPSLAARSGTAQECDRGDRSR